MFSLMIDPLLSLAVSLHSNKGIYALLLGSGISRSAGIPTGWEIVIDLVRKVANLCGEDCEPNPALWYRNKFGVEPDYSDLLTQIAKSPTERNHLLRAYFEASEEEIEQGFKIPTRAHKAIADLVSKGHLRVVITTNFDRLLEKALEEKGIVPTVISTPDSVEGALPLVHSACTIVKINGDYLDIRIKNTIAELESYEEPLNKLLDRIFDEFGLITCGRSSEWDIALRTAIERCKSHRFTTYWTSRGELNGTASKLLVQRRGELIKIKSADDFFQELSEKVISLQELSRPHPLSAKVAAASLKRYIADEKHKIRLHDLIMSETKRLAGEISDENFPLNTGYSDEEFLNRIWQYESFVEILQSLLIYGCYWGEQKHSFLWTKSIDRLANLFENKSGITCWLDLRLYPILLLLYAGGIASISAGRYYNLRAIAVDPNLIKPGKEESVALAIYPHAVLGDLGNRLPGLKDRYTPISDHLFRVLRNPLKELLPNDTDYLRCFDTYEYLFALIHADLNEKLIDPAWEDRVWGPVGCFGWRNRHFPELKIANQIEKQAKPLGDDWSPLKSGLFDGSFSRFIYLKNNYDKLISGFNWH